MKILESNEKIEKIVAKMVLQNVYKKLRIISDLIQEDIREFNLILWKSTDTYRSLLSGDLTHELGFPKGSAQRMVDAILLHVSNSIIVVPKLPRLSKQKNNRIASFKVVTRSLPGILNLPEAEIQTEKKAANDISGDFGSFGAQSISKTLPWVDWLLFRGNSYIIYNYEYIDTVSPRSRSGKGIMVPNDSENWRVPSEYSGTKNDNWITRTLTDNLPLIAKTYTEIINRHFNV